MVLLGLMHKIGIAGLESTDQATHQRDTKDTVCIRESKTCEASQEKEAKKEEAESAENTSCFQATSPRRSKYACSWYKG